ncbi:MAG TPA: hypothetical protein VHD61_01215 [Lacunisphaera sp.]|nr:hypothetical protein [Lacunisphaera sp.]
MKLSEDKSVRYVTKTGDQVGGPYTLEGLESLVYLQRITPDTLIAPEGSNEFEAIRATPLAPVLFKRIHDSQSPGAWAPPGRENDPAYIQRKRYQMTAAEFDNVNARARHLPKVDVMEILDDIRQTEIESGHDFVKENRFKVSRRSRDFWIMLVVGNAIFLGVPLIAPNTISFIFGIAGCGLFTFGLLWSLYGVMDRY